MINHSTVFGPTKITDKEAAIDYIRSCFNIAQETLIVEIFDEKVLNVLSSVIEDEIFNEIKFVELYCNNTSIGVVSPSQRTGKLDYEWAEAELIKFMSCQTEPLPFRVIREYFSITFNIDITISQWNNLHKRTTNLIRIGERADARWKLGQ